MIDKTTAGWYNDALQSHPAHPTRAESIRTDTGLLKIGAAIGMGVEHLLRKRRAGGQISLNDILYTFINTIKTGAIPFLFTTALPSAVTSIYNFVAPDLKSIARDVGGELPTSILGRYRPEQDKRTRSQAYMSALITSKYSENLRKNLDTSVARLDTLSEEDLALQRFGLPTELSFPTFLLHMAQVFAMEGVYMHVNQADFDQVSNFHNRLRHTMEGVYASYLALRAEELQLEQRPHKNEAFYAASFYTPMQGEEKPDPEEVRKIVEE